jgi:Spy/CpxP family protein refolding chaperone
MNALNTPKLIACFALLTGATAVLSQHQPARSHDVHGIHDMPGAANAAARPYAGQQTRDIKALSETQTQDLLAGKGMELAKAAELNGYPGPLHTLELAPQLELDARQKLATEALMAEHKAEARTLGAQLVQAERALDAAFSSRSISKEALGAQLQRIGQLQTALRQSHLQAHLQQTALLTPGQVSRYAQLRGYAGPTETPMPSTHRH